MYKNFSISTIAAATGFSTPWTQRMLANNKGKDLTVAQIACRLSLSKVYIYKMIHRGRLSAHISNVGTWAVTLKNLANWRLSIA